MQGIIQSFAKMVAEWIMSHLIMKGVMLAFSLFGIALKTKETATTIALESSKTPVYAMNAGLASASSYGASAWIGLAAFLAVLGAIAAAASGAFAEGGRPDVGKIALVGERGPELWVPDSAGTIVPNDKLGSALAGRREQQIHLVVVDSRSEARDYLDSVSGEQHIVKIVGKHKYNIL